MDGSLDLYVYPYYLVTDFNLSLKAALAKQSSKQLSESAAAAPGGQELTNRCDDWFVFDLDDTV